jgi:hypothetical protein
VNREQSVMRLLVFAMVLALACPVFAADNWLGTWKLNAAKTKYSPGPAPKSQLLKQEAWEGGVKLTTETVDSAGKTARAEYVAKYDGKDYPWKGNADADMISLKRIDDNSYDAVWKLKGKTTITSKTVVSRDGKTRTITQTGTDAQGRPVNNVTVYDRQ